MVVTSLTCYLEVGDMGSGEGKKYSELKVGLSCYWIQCKISGDWEIFIKECLPCLVRMTWFSVPTKVEVFNTSTKMNMVVPALEDPPPFSAVMTWFWWRCVLKLGCIYH